MSQGNALRHTHVGEDVWRHTSHLIYGTCCSNNNLCLLTGMETRCSLHFGRLTLNHNSRYQLPEGSAVAVITFLATCTAFVVSTLISNTELTELRWVIVLLS